MKEFKVYLTAFGDKNKDPKIRMVSVPTNLLNDDLSDLETIFKYGQNIYQEYKDCYSVSSRDIIEYKDDLYLIDDFGFIKKGDKKEIVGGYLAIDLEHKTSHPFLQKNFEYLIEKD